MLKLLRCAGREGSVTAVARALRIQVSPRRRARLPDAFRVPERHESPFCAESISPDSALKATWFLRDCGATTDFSTIFGAANPPPKRSFQNTGRLERWLHAFPEDILQPWFRSAGWLRSEAADPVAPCNARSSTFLVESRDSTQPTFESLDTWQPRGAYLSFQTT